MKIKTAELDGIALDWAVSKCEGREALFSSDWPHKLVDKYGRDCSYRRWSTAGQIIQREHINIRHTFTGGVYRTSWSSDAVHAEIVLPNGSVTFDPLKVVWEYGPTPIIAAMRCYVTAKLGDVVDVPDELL